MMRREGWIAAGCIVAGIVLLALTDGAALWARPLWLDEVVTYYLATGDSAGDVIRAVRVGGEWNPPLLPLLVWILGRFADVTPTLLRSFSVACVGAALFFVYAACRRRFSEVAAAAAVLAVASSTLVVSQAFEARFYAPWLCFAALFGWSLDVDATHASSRRRDVAVALSAVLLCAIHWFGVISLALMAAGFVVANRAQPRRAARVVAPALTGLVVLAACIPFLVGQRAFASNLLWVPPLSGAQVGAIARVFFVSFVPLAAAVLLLSRSLSDRPVVTGAGPTGSLSALAAPGLMPIALMIVSAVLQPSLLDRYAIVTVLCWAPLVALAVEPLGPRARLAAIAVLATVLAVNLADTVDDKQRFAALVAESRSAFDQAERTANGIAGGAPIVFQSMHTLFQVAGPERARDARFLELSDSLLDASFGAGTPLREHFRLERDIVRGLRRVYGFPPAITPAELDTAPRFFVVATDMSLPAGYKQVDLWGHLYFPRHLPLRLGPALAVFQR